MGYRSIINIFHRETSTTEVVTVADLKEYLQVSGTTYDFQFATIITAVRKQIEQYCNASLIEREVVLKVKVPSAGYDFMLPFAPVTGVMTVERKRCPAQYTSIELGDYFIDYGIITVPMSGEYRITYACGVDDNQAFQQAIKLQCAAVFNNRDNTDKNGWDKQAIAIMDMVKNTFF